MKKTLLLVVTLFLFFIYAQPASAQLKNTEGECICAAEWWCEEWSVCYGSGIKLRECIDINGCGIEDARPPIEQSCTPDATCNDQIQNQEEEKVSKGAKTRFQG